jgi:PIN domain nuclease of toxin-antitoxin system
VRVLLDTHTLLWYTLGHPRISATATALIHDPANQIFISPASYWELAIKISIGKVSLHQPYDDFIDACLNQYGFAILSIEPYHTALLLNLPYHHRDPFDRLLVAQSKTEDMPIISADTSLDPYGITRLW